jgi:hypothetical protein
VELVNFSQALVSILLHAASARLLAAAYIDPNTGGMLFQVLAIVFAFLSGSLLFFSAKIRMFFAKIFRRFREMGEAESPTGDSTNS